MQPVQFLGAAVFGAAAAAGLCLLRSEYEKNHFVTERFVIRSKKIRGGGKTFVFLTDLHSKEFGRDNERLIAAVRKAAPDAVLVGGDMMVCRGRTDASAPLSLLKKLAEEFPVYYGNGNHENRMKRENHIYKNFYEEYRSALKKAGVFCLDHDTMYIGEDFAVCGLDLPRSLYQAGYPKMEPGYLRQKLGDAPAGRFTILLAHSPLFFDEYAAWGADLTLSGHFHGGTIRLPILGGVMTPQYQFFYPRCAGMFDNNGRKMIVGRGLGTHSVNIRINDKPQVVVVRVEN